MRRILTPLCLAAVLLQASAALAKDDPPPPPPPPPPSSEGGDTAEKKEGDAPSSGDFRSADALLDASKGKKRPMMLSFFLNLPWPGYYVSAFGLSASARFNIPIVHDGFVPQINDSFDLEFGLDIGIVPGAGYYNYSPIYILPIVEPRYTVYLLPNLAVYAKPLNLGFVIWPNNFGGQVLFFHYNFAAGVIFKLTPNIHLRGEIGTYALRAGIGIAF